MTFILYTMTLPRLVTITHASVSDLRLFSTSPVSMKRIVGSKEFDSHLVDGVSVEVDNPAHPQHTEYIAELRAYMDSHPDRADTTTPLSTVIMTDEQWNMLSEFTQRILLVIYRERTSVPSDALGHPQRLEEFRRTETLYRAVESNVKSTSAARAPKTISIDGVLVDYAKAVSSDYVILDPMKPTVVVYLTTDAYLRLIAQMSSANISVKVLLGPGEPRQSTNLPPVGGTPVRGWKFLLSGKIPLGYICFLPAGLRSLQWINSIKELPLPKVFSARDRLVTSSQGRQLIVRSYSVLLSVLILSGSRPAIRKAAMQFLSGFYQLVSHHGLAHACTLYKESRRIFYKYLNATPVFSTDVCLGITRDGLPRVIPSTLRVLIRKGDLTAIRIANFILDIGKLYEYEARGKISPIILPPKPIDPALMDRIISFIPRFRKILESSVGNAMATRDKLTSRRFNFTTKAGPNGPALLTCFLDAFALRGHESFMPFEKLCILTGNHRLLSRVILLAAVTGKFIGFLGVQCISRLNVGKISTTPNPYGKVRIFAIPTYWVQVLLYPVHSVLFDILKRIETDFTFDQTAAIPRIVQSQARCIFSYDLSAATDRFPLSVQELILTSIFPESDESFSRELFTQWADLLRQTEFSYTDSFVPDTKSAQFSINRKVNQLRKDTLKAMKFYNQFHSELSGCLGNGVLRRAVTSDTTYLKYAAGQPMGTYSSWAAFTLCHHFIVQMSAAEVLGDLPSWYSDYALLGDDIVLYSTQPHGTSVAHTYREVMEGLGVEVNPAKGLESSNGTFEFAKRLVRNGEDLSPFHWKEIFLIHTPGKFHDYLKYKLLPIVERLPVWCIVTAFVGLIPGTSLPNAARISLLLEENRWDEIFILSRPVYDLVVLMLSPFGIAPTLFSNWVALLQGASFPAIDKDNDAATKATDLPSFKSYYASTANSAALINPLLFILYEQFMGQVISGMEKTFHISEYLDKFRSSGPYGITIGSGKSRSARGSRRVKKGPRSALLTQRAIQYFYTIVLPYHPVHEINKRASVLSFLSVKPSPGPALAKALGTLYDKVDDISRWSVDVLDVLNRSAVALAGEAAHQRGILRDNTFCSIALPAGFDIYRHYPTISTRLRNEVDMSIIGPDINLMAIDNLSYGGSRAFVPPGVQRLLDPDETVRVLKWGYAIRNLDSYMSCVNTVLGKTERFLELVGIRSRNAIGTVNSCVRIQPPRLIGYTGTVPAPTLVTLHSLPNIDLGAQDPEYCDSVSSRPVTWAWGGRSVLPTWSYNDSVSTQLSAQAASNEVKAQAKELSAPLTTRNRGSRGRPRR